MFEKDIEIINVKIIIPKSLSMVFTKLYFFNKVVLIKKIMKNESIHEASPNTINNIALRFAP